MFRVTDQTGAYTPSSMVGVGGHRPESIPDGGVEVLMLLGDEGADAHYASAVKDPKMQDPVVLIDRQGTRFIWGFLGPKHPGADRPRLLR